MVKKCPMYWKWGSFLVRSKKLPKFQDFHSQILLNDFDFWQFSTPPRHVGGCGKFPNLNIFAPFGLWKSWTKKVPCPVHKKSKTMCVGFWLFLFFCCCFCCFFCMIWFYIIIFSPPEHRKHHLNLKWGDLIFWFRPISCTHFATFQHMVWSRLFCVECSPSPQVRTVACQIFQIKIKCQRNFCSIQSEEFSATLMHG